MPEKKKIERKIRNNTLRLFSLRGFTMSNMCFRVKLLLPEYQGTLCSKQMQYLKIMWLQQDSNSQSLRGQTRNKSDPNRSVWLIGWVFLYLLCERGLESRPAAGYLQGIFFLFWLLDILIISLNIHWIYIILLEINGVGAHFLYSLRILSWPHSKI